MLSLIKQIWQVVLKKYENALLRASIHISILYNSSFSPLAQILYSFLYKDGLFLFNQLDIINPFNSF